MDAAGALADLTEISSQIESALVVGADGAVVAATFEGAEPAAAAAAQLLDAAGEGVTQLQASTGRGSVFVVRDGDRTIAATTSPNPTVGLVFYDLRSALRSIDVKPKRKRAPRKKADDAP
jgi:predicted regulator of Ras-like GTPase activity (Roadblock/LC7/MglB family)